LEYLNTASENGQKQIIDNTEKEAVAYMQSTKFFNLQSPTGRRGALCQILTLLRWYDARMPLVNDDSEEEDIDSDDYMEL
jgi:hypothetical protein